MSLKRKFNNKELARLQEELVKLQYWIKEKNLKVVVIFVGRDALGKGGVIKRIIRRINPRIVRVVALGVPAWETKWILSRHFDLKWPENWKENHRDDK